jgi:hypothetical protein
LRGEGAWRAAAEQAGDRDNRHATSEPESVC